MIATRAMALDPADDVDELRRAVRELKQQIQALSKRTSELETERDAALKERDATSNAARALSELKAPAAPADTNTARNPQDATALPGTVSIGPSVPANPIASGGQDVRVTLSGQINRALLYGNDGYDSKLRNVDNNNSSTRIRIFGVGQLDADTFVGGQIETEIRSNTSARVRLRDDGAPSADSVTFTERQLEVIGYSRRYGRVRLGQGSTASDEVTQADLSDTALAGYVQVSDFDGGFEFRPKNSMGYGPQVSNVFNYFSGLIRDDRIRYDTPSFEGFTASTSAIDGGAWDAALRYAGQNEYLRVVAAVGYANASSRDKPLPATTALNSQQVSGSVSVLYRPLGLSLTGAAGERHADYTDANGASLQPRLWYGKLGWQHRFVSFGGTAFSIDFAQNQSLSQAHDNARAYGFEVVQHVDRVGTDLFLGYRDQRLDREGTSFNALRALMSGVRVRF